MPEVDENTHARLNGAYQLLDQLLKDPRTREKAEELVKVHRPDFPTTSDVIEPTRKEIQELRKEFRDYLRKQEDDRQDILADDAFARHRKSGLTEEGEKAVKELMRKRTIPDVDAAVALYEKNMPKAEPAKPTGLGATPNFGFGKPTNDDDKLLFENEDLWAEKEALKAWEESAA
jgi:hypothetical protein